MSAVLLDDRGAIGVRNSHAVPDAAASGTRSAATVDPIDVLLTRHERLPRGQWGAFSPPSGRVLLKSTAAALRRIDISHELRTDQERRWEWPDLQLCGSVSHTGRWSATTLSQGFHTGIDLQDPRERPGAFAFLGDLVDNPEGAISHVQFAECESIVKATHLTKETFGHVRLPRWRPGWRRIDIGAWLLSLDVPGLGALAITSHCPAPVQWWVSSTSSPGSVGEPRPVEQLTEAVRSWL